MESLALICVAAALIFVATVSQTVRSIPAAGVVAINAVAVPVGGQYVIRI